MNCAKYNTAIKISESKYIGDDGTERICVVYEARALKVSVYYSAADTVDVTIDVSDVEAYTHYYCDGSFVPRFSVQYAGHQPMEAVVVFPEMTYDDSTLRYLCRKIIPEVNTTLTALNALFAAVREENRT